MQFLSNLTIAAAITKAKLKAGKGKTATIEFCVPIAESPLNTWPGGINSVVLSSPGIEAVELRAKKGKSKPVSAGADEILAAVPKVMLKAYNAMRPHGATSVDFDIEIKSQNIEASMAPDVPPSLRLTDLKITDLRLEAMDAESKYIGLHFSVTDTLTADIGNFLVTNLGQFVFLSISECQQELAKAAEA